MEKDLTSDPGPLGQQKARRAIELAEYKIWDQTWQLTSDQVWDQIAHEIRSQVGDQAHAVFQPLMSLFINKQINQEKTSQPTPT